MKIEHIAIWVSNLEKMKEFYETYFEAKAGPLYHNPTKRFTSYFLTWVKNFQKILPPFDILPRFSEIRLLNNRS